MGNHLSFHCLAAALIFCLCDRTCGKERLRQIQRKDWNTDRQVFAFTVMVGRASKREEFLKQAPHKEKELEGACMLQVIHQVTNEGKTLMVKPLSCRLKPLPVKSSP